MKNQNKIYLALASFTVITIALVVFLIYPTLEDIKGSSREIVSYKEATALIYRQNKAINNFNKNFAEYESNLRSIEESFIDPKNPVNFIRFLEKTALEMGVSLDVGLAENIKKEPSNSSPFSLFKINAEGGFLDVIRFAEKLESGPYLLQFQTMSISGGGGKEKKSANIVRASFVAQVINK